MGWRVFFALVPRGFAAFIMLMMAACVLAIFVVASVLENYLRYVERSFGATNAHVSIAMTLQDEDAFNAANTRFSEEVAHRNGEERLKSFVLVPAVDQAVKLIINPVQSFSEICLAEPIGGKRCVADDVEGSRYVSRAYRPVGEIVRRVRLRGVDYCGVEQFVQIEDYVSGEIDFCRMQQRFDDGGNLLTAHLIGQDTLFVLGNDNFLIRLSDSGEHSVNFRLRGLLRIGVKASGPPMLMTSRSQAAELIGESAPFATHVEIFDRDLSGTDDLAVVAREMFGADAITTWQESGRSSLNLLWVIQMLAYATIIVLVTIGLMSTASVIRLTAERCQTRIALLLICGMSRSSLISLCIGRGCVIALIGGMMGAVGGLIASDAISQEVFLDMDGTKTVEFLSLAPSTEVIATTFIAMSIMTGLSWYLPFSRFARAAIIGKVLKGA